MIRIFLTIGLLFSVHIGTGQNEFVLAGVEYNWSALGLYLSEDGDLIDYAANHNQFATFETNLPFELNSKNLLIGGLEITSVGNRFLSDKSMISPHGFEDYYETPSHNLLASSLTLRTSLPNKWFINNTLSVSLSDDFLGSAYRPNAFLGGTTFLQKETSRYFSWGAGVSLSRFRGRLFLSPMVSMDLNKTKWGLGLVFPERIRLWFRTGKRSYMNAMVRLNSYFLKYQTDDISKDLSIFNSELSFNHIKNDFLRFKIGLAMPTTLFVINAENQIENYSLFDLPNIVFGLALTIDSRIKFF